MTLTAPVLTLADLVDEPTARPVLSSATVHHGLIWDLQRDTVDLGEGGVVEREYVRHPGAVIVVALREPRGEAGPAQVFLIKQYRHPVGAIEWELPAGLLDAAGEPPWQAAARELAEEADLRAQTWHVLADYYASPGGMTEALRIYLARGLSDVPEQERHTRQAEEVGMPTGWMDLSDLVTAALTGRLNNVGAIVGVLAVEVARERRWTSLRPHDTPWPQHPTGGIA